MSTRSHSMVKKGDVAEGELERFFLHTFMGKPIIAAGVKCSTDTDVLYLSIYVRITSICEIIR